MFPSANQRLKDGSIEPGREDAELRVRLCDAGAAGAVVARHPSNKESRRDAQRAWQALEKVTYYLKCEEPAALNSAESQGFAYELVQRARERQDELIRLVQILDAASFIEGSNPSVESAGCALCALAFQVSDLISGDELALFPMVLCELPDLPEASAAREAGVGRRPTASRDCTPWVAFTGKRLS